MSWIVRLTGQGCDYGPFTDRATADSFAAFLAAEVDPAEVIPAGPNPTNLMDPVRELLAWRDMHLDPTHQAPPCKDRTALAAAAHVSRDVVMVASALAAWLRDPGANGQVPGNADRMLAHIAETANAARALLAREAADLDKIRTIGDTPE